jgi:hypothetical protein
MEVSGVSFTPWPLYPRERAPGSHLIGGFVGPRAGLDAAVRRKIPNPSRDSNPGSSNSYLSAVPHNVLLLMFTGKNCKQCTSGASRCCCIYQFVVDCCLVTDHILLLISALLVFTASPEKKPQNAFEFMTRINTRIIYSAFPITKPI